MRRAGSWGAVMAAVVLGLEGCSGVVCGAGTRLEGNTCVPDAPDAGDPRDAGPDARADAEPGRDAGSDAGPPPSTDGSTGRLEEGDPCPTDPSGFNTLRPACDGNDLLYCNGTKVRRTDCTALGDRCQPGASEGELPRCAGGVYAACSVATSTGRCADEGHSLVCGSGYPNAPGFYYSIPCASFGAGYTCRAGSTSGGCVPPGTTACDPSAHTSACSADGVSIVRCENGLSTTVPCARLFPGTVCDLGPGDEPTCVPPGSARCDTRTYTGRCVSDTVVEQCAPVTAHVTTASCGAGTSCRVSERGFAACVASESRSCDPSTYVARCFDHTRLAGCNNRGFESSFDCTLSGPGAFCLADTPARCGVADVCDPAAYAARCEGQTALNCRTGGWVERAECSPFTPCRVVSGVARCEG